MIEDGFPIIKESEWKAVPGMMAGALELIRPDTSKTGSGLKEYWLCKCHNCNSDKLVSISSANLRNGKTSSCGCITSKGELQIKQFFENNNAINIVKDGKLFKYEVCSVYVDNVKNLNIALAFNSKEDFLNYATNEISKSLYSKDISISEEDNLLTLVTCSYEYTDARTVVVAVRK